MSHLTDPKKGKKHTNTQKRGRSGNLFYGEKSGKIGVGLVVVANPVVESTTLMQ